MASLGYIARPHFKKKKKERGCCGVTKVVEHLTSKHEALSSNPSIRKKERGEGRKEGRVGGKEGGREERRREGGWEEL
jgi:hypothetical protein